MHESRKMSRALKLALLLTPLLAASLASLPALAAEEAYEEGNLPAEIGLLGRYVNFDNDVPFDSGIGIGARVMAFFDPNWGVDVDGTWARVDGPPYSPKVSVFTAHGHLLYGIPLGTKSQFLLGLGFVHNRYNKNIPHWEDSGVGGLVGLRLGLNPHWSVRFDGTYDYMPNSGDAWDLGHMGLQAGINFSPSYNGPTREESEEAMESRVTH